MNTLELLTLIKRTKPNNAIDGLKIMRAIDAMSDEERIAFRTEAEKRGIKMLPRNLFYNYTTQTWILTAEEKLRIDAQVSALINR